MTLKIYQKLIICQLLIVMLIPAGFAQDLKEKPAPRLTHHLSEEEKSRWSEVGRDFTPTNPPVGPVRAIAESGRMQAVLIRYPFGIPMALIVEMSQDIQVTTIVTNSTQENQVRAQYQSNGVNLSNCNFLYAPSDSYWTRDYGPWFILDGNDDISIVDFPYNRPRPNDDNVPVKVSQNLGVPLYGMNVIHTGGNHMTDGMGISSSSDLVWTENPGLTHQQVAQYFDDFMGVSTYHVVPDPNNTYIDHIDCWGKFLDVDKVLIRQVPASHPQYDEIEATAAYYAAQTSSYGNLYQVFRVNTPNNQPYTNSLILNKKVFVPIMNSTYDAAALEVYQEAMPGYEIIGVLGNPATPWESTDALHCRAIGIADVGMLHIAHQPILGIAPVQTSYTLTADITACSGQPVYTDSVLVYYSVNGGIYSPVNMTSTGGKTWSATISGAPQGSEIRYYIHAADQSGRSENHPFIGGYDPHVFYVGSQAFAQIAINPVSLEVNGWETHISTVDLNINNLGLIDLNFSITPNTLVTETLDYAIPNSPAQNAYDFNTYTELGWTDFTVNDDGLVANWQVTFSWTADSYPEEGAFRVKSPQGTETVIIAGFTSGTYTIDLNSFNNQPLLGTWRLWITDTYGDGGCRATNITMKITRVVSNIPWLTVDTGTGTVAPGSSSSVGIQCDGSMVSAGTYTGSLTVTSNDPVNPEIVIPVSFFVDPLGDIAAPDTLLFEENHIEHFTISNPTNHPLTLLNVSTSGPFWTVMDAPQFPAVIETNGEITMSVLVLGVKDEDRYTYIYDSIEITSEVSTHYMVLKINDLLISGVNEILESSLKAVPNPFNEGVEVSLDITDPGLYTFTVINIFGNTVEKQTVNIEKNGNHRWNWKPAGLPKGIYFVEISGVSLRKFLKVVYQ